MLRLWRAPPGFLCQFGCRFSTCSTLSKYLSKPANISLYLARTCCILLHILCVYKRCKRGMHQCHTGDIMRYLKSLTGPQPHQGHTESPSRQDLETSRPTSSTHSPVSAVAGICSQPIDWIAISYEKPMWLPTNMLFHRKVYKHALIEDPFCKLQSHPRKETRRKTRLGRSVDKTARELEMWAWVPSKKRSG